MGALAQEIIAILESNDSNKIKDSLWIAGDLIAKFNRKIYRSGFDWIDAEEIDAIEHEQLSKCLLTLLQNCNDIGTKGSIINALCKSNNTAYKEIYITHLKEALTTLLNNNAIIHQCIIALDNLDENIIERNDKVTGQNITEIDQSIARARKYLAQKNIVIPW